MIMITYGWPVKKEDIEGYSYAESPVHRAVVELMCSCDFIVPLNSDVFAMYNGVVTYVRQDSKQGGNDLAEVKNIKDSKFWNLGNRIEIYHGNFGGKKIYTAYEHLAFEGCNVRKKDQVKKGDKIAVTGYTGLMAHLGPHLHVERFIKLGLGEEDYQTIPICFENEEKLLKYFWDYRKWKEIGSREIHDG